MRGLVDDPTVEAAGVLGASEFVGEAQIFQQPPGVGTPICRLTDLIRGQLSPMRRHFDELQVDIIDNGLKDLAFLAG